MKTFKKAVSFAFSALAVLVLSGFVSLQPVGQGGNTYLAVQAHHTDPLPCNDITMVPGTRTATEPVLSPSAEGRQAGVPDSGQFDFNALAHGYQACAENSETTRTLDTVVTAKFLRGWVWNTNLGYVSLSCENGTNYGGACGNINYGVFANRTSGAIRGFAYGDNVGWISMGCDADGKNAGVPCGGTQYGVQVALADGTNGGSCTGTGAGGTLNRGDIYGYAWTNTVGWMNFCGAHADPDSLFAPPITLDVGFTDFSSFSSSTETTGGLVYASLGDYHEITVKVLEDGSPIGAGTPDRQITITPAWTDTVRADQVTQCGGNGQPACAYNGSEKDASFAWDGARSSYAYKIRSKAPTGAQDKIALAGLTVDVRDGAGNVLRTFEYSAGLPHSFDFAPPATVTKISAADTSGSFSADQTITTLPNSSQELRFDSVSQSPTIGVYAQLYNCSTEYTFVFDPAGDGIVQDENGNPDDTTVTPGSVFPDVQYPVYTNNCSLADTELLAFNYSGTAGAATTFIYTAPSSATVSSIETPNALGVQTIVAYTAGGVPVRYFSQKSSDGSVLNQAADVRGDVRIDVRDTSGIPAASRISETIGERAESKREPFYRAIIDAVGTQKPRAFDFGTANRKVINGKTLNASAGLGATGLLYFKRTAIAGADEKPCTIIFDDSADAISFTKKVTVVSEGCDIFIDKNILAPSGRLGIIALEDLTMAGARKGGNVYICSAVTDVEANFVLDNSIMSYGVDAASCGGADKSGRLDANGYPVFGAPLREALKNQLTIVGSLISNNTYGGSLASVPVLGDGRLAKTTEEKAAARWFDINFLRYAQTRPHTYDPSIRCWDTDVGISKTLNPYNFGPDDLCDAKNDPVNRSIVNVIYRAPDASLPVFKGVK